MGDFECEPDFVIPSASQLFSIPTQTLLFDSMTGSSVSDKSRLQRFGDPISDDKLKEKFRESIPKKTRKTSNGHYPSGMAGYCTEKQKWRHCLSSLTYQSVYLVFLTMNLIFGYRNL